MSDLRAVLVTGGNGFIGRHLVLRLLEDGHRVTMLQRSDDLPRGAELLHVSRLTPDMIDRTLAGRRFDWLFHFASYGVAPADREIEPMFRVNVEVTRRIVEIAAGWAPSAVIVAGTGQEYRLDGVQQPVPEDHPLEPFKLYGASKAAGTLCALAIARASCLPLVVARMFGVYGPDEAPHRLLPALARGLRSGRRVPLTAGDQRRDVLFVEDAVDAFIRIARTLESKPDQLILNVCSGAPLTVRAFAEAVARVLDAPLDRLGFGEIAKRPDEVMCFAGDPARLHAFTGWQPRFSLEAGIKQSLNEFAGVV
jgi:UDP-glucose 4-epimerase